jgi:hypothetical protein
MRYTNLFLPKFVMYFASPASVLYDAEGQPYNPTTGAYVSPAIGTPSPSSLDSGGDGGILQSLGSDVQGISNIGLQWFTAVTKGVQTKLQTPQPVQATPAAATANLVNQAVSYLPWIIIILAIILILPKLFGRK